MVEKTNKHERLRGRPGSDWEETLRIVEETPNGATGTTVWQPPTPGERSVRPPEDENVGESPQNPNS